MRQWSAYDLQNAFGEHDRRRDGSQLGHSGVESWRYKGLETGTTTTIVTLECNRRNQRQALLAAGLMAKAVKAEVTPFRGVSAKIPGLAQSAI
jgi:hypothetical protein